MKVRIHNTFLARAGKYSVAAVLFLSFFIQPLLFSPGFSDDDYGTWDNWRYVYLITDTDGANVTGEVCDVPVLIRLNPGNFDGLTSTADDGSDIRFSKDDGTHLYYDIERWQHTSSTIDTAEIWVLVDTVKASDTTTLKMYWNKTGAVDSSYSEKVFDPANSFAGVWHMDSSYSGTGTVDVYLDATGNGNHGDDYTGSASKTGIIGKGQEFDGSGDYVVLGDLSSSNWSAITIGAWINLDVDQTGERAIIRKNNQFQLGVLPSGNEIRNLVATSGTTGWTEANDESYTINTGTWYYFACTYTDADDVLKHYANGSQVGSNKTVSGTVTDNSSSADIGANTGGGSLNLDGYIDEMRISTEARSADWIKLCYQNQRLTSGRDSLVWFSASFTTAAVPYTWDVNASSGFQPGDGTWGVHDYWSESTGDGTSPGAYPGANTIATFAGSDGSDAYDYYITVNGTQDVDSLAFLNFGYCLASGTINLGSNKGIYVAAEKSAVISAAISGTGGMTKTGDGRLILTGTSTYSGNTAISEGLLSIGNGSTSGSVSGNITANDTLFFNRSDDITFSGDISGTGKVYKYGAGKLTFTGSVTHTGGTYNYDGTGIQIGNGGTSGSISGTIYNSVGMTFNRSDDITFSGDITYSGTVTKLGAGTLTLSGTNTYTGVTTISAGTIQIGAGGTTGAISNSSDITNNSALVFNRSDAYAYSGVISGTGTITNSGGGTTTLSGTNTCTGAVTISAGTLLVTNTSGSGTGTGDVTVADGATLGGTGTITGDVTVSSGGTLAPGTSTGKITFDDLTLSSGSNFSVELNGTTVETQYDQLKIDGITGTVALGSATLSLTLGFAPSNGNTFIIIDNDDDEAVSGTFNGISEGGSISASYSGTPYGFTVSYTGGTDNNDVVLTCTGELPIDNYSQWPYSQKIQINTSIGGAMITTNQYDFPLLVRLDSTRFHRFDQTFDNGADIRFANKYGEHLYYDIEHWVDNTGDNDSAAIWVRVDTISANSWSNYITMYWGKSGAPDSSSSEKVFDTANAFTGVWHLDETSGNFADATSNSYDGSDNVDAGGKEGEIGAGQEFDGTDDHITVADGDNFIPNTSTHITASAWFNADNFSADFLGRRIFTIPGADTTSSAFVLAVHTWGGSDRLVYYNGVTYRDGTDGTISTDTWTYGAVTWDGSDYRLYLNGALDKTDNDGDATAGAAGAKARIGIKITDELYAFDGHLDEVRFSQTARSTDWIKLCYETQKSVTDTIVDIENYADWGNSQNITINTTSTGADVSGDVYNFPLLVRLDTSNFDGFANTLANGDDIRFSKSNGVHLPYEIEQWKDGASNIDTAAIWVLLDTVFGNNSSQYFTMYWGKEGATSRSNGRMAFDTTASFAGVWHLDEDPTGGANAMKDRTTNAFNGSAAVGTEDQSSSLIGYGVNFATGNEGIDLSDRFEYTSGTVSLWLKPTTTINASYPAAGSLRPQGKDGDYEMRWTAGDGALDIDYDGGPSMSSTTTTWTAGSWYHIAVSWNGSGQTLYVNGTSEATGAAFTPANTATSFYIGRSGSGEAFNGIIDEARVATTNRTADWIRLCYETQRSDQITVTSEEVMLLPITVNFGAKATRGNDTCEIYTDDWKIIFDEDVGGGIKWLSYEKAGSKSNQLAAGTNLFYIKTGGQTSNSMSGTLTLLDSSSLFATVRQNFSIGTPSTHPWQIEYTVYGCGRAFVRVETEALASNYTPTGGLEFRVETDVSNKEYSAEDDNNANLSNYILHSDKGSGKYDVLLALYEDWQYEGFDSASGFTVETGDYYGYVDDNWDLPAGNKRVWEFLLDFGHRKWNDTAGVGKVVDDYRDENDRDSLEFIKGTYRMEKAWEHNLTGHWPFDDGSGSTADDVAGASNDHNGTVNNATWVDGVWNGALDFDGTGDDVTVTTNKADFNDIVFTIMMWVKPETGTPLSTSTVLFSKWSSNTGYKLAGNSGKLELTLDGTTITANNGIGTNSWRHVAVTYHYHSGRIKFYVDGKIDRYAVSQYPVTSNTDNVVMGEGFVGLMDDVRFYKKEISEETIRAISQNGYRVNQGQYMLRADNNNTVHIKIDGSSAEPEYFPIFQIDNYWATHTPSAVYYNGSSMASTGDYIASLNDADNILYLGFNKRVTATDLLIYIDDTDNSGAFMVGPMPKMYWSAGTHFSAQNFSGTDFGATGSNEFYLYWKMNTTANEKNGEINAFKSSEISASTPIASAANTIYESDIYTFGMFLGEVNSQTAFSSSEVDATPSYAVLESSDVRIRLQINERAVDGTDGYDITTIWTLYPTGQIFRYDTIDNLDANFTAHWIYFMQKYEATGISYYDDNTNLRGGVYGGSATHDFAVCVLGTADKDGSAQLITGAADPVDDNAESPHLEGIMYEATDDLVTTDAPFKYAYYLDIQTQTMDDTYMDAVCDGVQNIDYNSADFSGGTGALVDTTEGDLNGDGFNEAEGAYVMRADDNSVNFLLETTNGDRYYPAFRILDYTATSKPNYVHLYNASDTITCIEDYTYNCYLNDSKNELILQLDTVLDADTKIYISCDDELAVELSDFYAKAGDGHDTLFWRTESEEDNLGFFLFRRISPHFLDSLAGVIDTVTDSLLDNAGVMLKQGRIGFADTVWISLTKDIIPTQYKPGEIPGITRKYIKIDWDVENDIMYEYKLIAIDKNRSEEEFGPIHVIPQIRLPKRFFLFHNFPNPARFYTNFRFDLPVKSKVSLYIYNLQGRLIARILTPDRYMKPGFYLLRWKCSDQHGRKIASGPYIYRFAAKGVNKKKYAKNRMMILIK